MFINNDQLLSKFKKWVIFRFCDLKTISNGLLLTVKNQFF